ncbi:hypothetical protein [Nocardia vulneris]|nr:hypothetical protein [Nocardia vulneris]
MTPEQLARKIEVDPKTVQRWITQGRTPYPVHQFAVAVAIGVPERELWPEGYTHHRSQHLQSVPDSSEPRPSTIRIRDGGERGHRDHNGSEARPSVGEPGTVLKSLLREKHWQSHPEFQRAYDKVAQQIEPELVGTAPAKAQFYRWLAGDIQGLPRAHYCRVLEAMFPGKTVEELFAHHTRTPIGPAGEIPVQHDHERVSSRDRVEGVPAAERPRPVSSAAANARMRELMSWVDLTSPLKERDIHADRERPQDHRTYSRGSGVERTR